MSSTEFMKEQSLERQLGCIAGFLHIFDRHQYSVRKRHRSAKRLPPSSHVADSASESERSAPASPLIIREIGKPSPERTKMSPAVEVRSPAEAGVEFLPKAPLPMIESRDAARSSWKVCKEAPRLSLDSRATTDAKGSLHPKEIRTAASVLHNRCESVASDATDDSQLYRSPSVIARLMGLEPLPDSSSTEPENKPELRRSASESRVSRDLFHSRFIANSGNSTSKRPTPSQSAFFSNIVRDSTALDAPYANPRNYFPKNAAEQPKGLNRGSFSSSQWRAPPHRKNFFDSGDFFPDPKNTLSIGGEIDSRLRVRGLDESSKDLETLKQILEALQLKGLLHSRKLPEQIQTSHRNFVYDVLPIVVSKTSTLSTPPPLNRKPGIDYSPPNGKNQGRGPRRSNSLTGNNSPLVSPRRERNTRTAMMTGRTPSPTNGSEANSAVWRRPNSLVKTKPLSIETPRRTNDSTDNRRLSPAHSPKRNTSRTGADPTVNSSSPRSRKMGPIHQKEKIPSTASAEDETSSVSGSSITTSTTDTESSKTEEYKEGRNLLERCDKLLHSIAEMTATADMQPSPVSVLDSSFYKDESSTPSPVTTRRNLEFKDQSNAMDDETWSPVVAPIPSKCDEISDDSDLVYISDILRACNCFPEDSDDIFLLLEKQQYLKGKDTTQVSKLGRRLVFDTINEILDRNRRLPPWKVVTWMNHNLPKPSLGEVWSEFQRIREHHTAEDLVETICNVLKKDLAGDAITGWGDCPEEMSESILDIERQIFKDLISDTIRDLAALASQNTASCMSRRKLFV